MYIPQFDRTFERMVDHRWSSLTNTMVWLLPLEGILIQVWRPGLFGRYDSKPGADVDVSTEKITAAISCKWFWAFLRMCNELCSILLRLGQWAESCSCHSRLIRVSATSPWKEHHRAALFKKLVHRGSKGKGLAFMWSHCPMSGRHAAELACGMLRELLDELFLFGAAAVLRYCQGLTTEEIDSITVAFDRLEGDGQAGSKVPAACAATTGNITSCQRPRTHDFSFES